MEGEEVLKSGRGGKEWWEAGGGAGKNYLRWEEGVRSDVLCLPSLCTHQEIRPFETKNIMRVNFVGHVARVHSGYIRIKTNRLAEDEGLVLPVMVEVTRSEYREGRGGEGRV